MAETTLKGFDDVLRDEADADAIGMDGREDLALEAVLDLLEPVLTELALNGRRDEDEVGALSVGDSLKMAVVDRDDGAAAENDYEEDGARVVVPPAGGAAAEVLELTSIEVIEATPLGRGIGDRVRVGVEFGEERGRRRRMGFRRRDSGGDGDGAAEEGK